MRAFVPFVTVLTPIVALLLAAPNPAVASLTLVEETEPDEYGFIGDVVVSADARFLYASAP